MDDITMNDASRTLEDAGLNADQIQSLVESAAAQTHVLEVSIAGWNPDFDVSAVLLAS